MLCGEKIEYTRNTKATRKPAAPQRQPNAAALVLCPLNNACRRFRSFVGCWQASNAPTPVSILLRYKIQCRYGFVRASDNRCSLERFLFQILCLMLQSCTVLLSHGHPSADTCDHRDR